MKSSKLALGTSTRSSGRSPLKKGRARSSGRSPLKKGLARLSGKSPLKTEQARSSSKPSLKTAQTRSLDIENEENEELKERNASALKIQKAWSSYMDRMLFQLLKQSICAAENHVSDELLKNVSPLEAELFKDPGMKCKIRFRFGGETFPPVIMFKIFLHNEGHGYKFINGKELLKSSNQAVVDAYKIMGGRTFYHQIKQDDYLHQKFKITDEVDIVTLQDYMQYCSLLDKTPASSGGRNNHWRRLNLENIPRTMMIYDIVNYAQSGILSKRLQKEMKYLIQKPQTDEMHQSQLQTVSKVRYPVCYPRMRPSYWTPRKQSEVKHLGRRSKQAKIKVEAMRKAYKKDKEKDAPAASETQVDTRKHKETVIYSTSSFDLIQIEEISSDELNEEEKELFLWCQDVFVKNDSST